MYCPKCGMQNAENARMCVSCGSFLPASVSGGPSVEIKTSGLAIVDAMNGTPRPGTEEPGVYVKKRRDISRPSDRLVFVDQGWAAPESFPVHYDQARWWCEPPLTHRDGTSGSFADGHVEFWRWKAPETLRIARRPKAASRGEHIAPETPEGKDDLQRFQIAVWGQLGYTSAP